MGTIVLELLRDTYDAFLARNDAAEDVHNALCGVAVPEGWDPSGLAFAGQGSASSGDHLLGVGTHKQIGALSNRNGSLGVLPKRETRDAQGSGLFLDAARIGQDQRGAAEEAKKIEVANRLDELKVRMMGHARLGEALPCTRMDGKDNG